jgi:hypothetical protein
VSPNRRLLAPLVFATGLAAGWLLHRPPPTRPTHFTVPTSVEVTPAGASGSPRILSVYRHQDAGGGVTDSGRPAGELAWNLVIRWDGGDWCVLSAVERP